MVEISEERLADLEAASQELTDIKRRRILEDIGLTGDDIDAALTHITAEDPAEIQTQAEQLLRDLRIAERILERSRGADPSLGNGFRYMPQPKSGDQIGRDLYHRVKRKQR